MRKLTIVLLVPLLFSCIDDNNKSLENPVELQDFSVTARSDYFQKYDEAYIILHDTDGSPIDYKQIHDGETIIFQVDKSKKYHVTEYKIDDSSGKDNAFLATHLDQDLSENLTLGKEPSNVLAPNWIGDFNVEVTNSEPLVAVLSAKGYTSEYKESATSINTKMRLFSDENKYFTSATSESGHSRYQFVENPEENKTYSLDFNDMKEFDQVLKLKASEYSNLYYSIISQREINGKDKNDYVLALSTWNPIPDDFYELGYLDNIEKYETIVSGKKNPNSKASFTYQKLGSAPTEIQILDIEEIKIQKSVVTNFEYQTTLDDAQYTTTFISPLSFVSPTSPDFQFLQWDVTGQSANFSLELPEELKNQSNLIENLNQLQLSSVSILKMLEKDNSLANETYEITEVSQDFE